MLEFFAHYIHPTSPVRAKLTVHMHAQGKSKTAKAAAEQAAVKVGEKVTAAVEAGIEKLGLKDESQKVVAEGEEKKEVLELVVVEDVREYKSSLAVTPGPRPVKDLSVFEEIDAKL
jgi:insulysin